MKKTRKILGAAVILIISLAIVMPSVTAGTRVGGNEPKIVNEPLPPWGHWPIFEIFVFLLWEWHYQLAGTQV